MHGNKSKVPQTCIAATCAGSAIIVAAAAHHGSISVMPKATCMAATAAGVAGVGYGVSAHADNAEVPTSCKVYTALGLVLLVVGTALLSAKK